MEIVIHKDLENILKELSEFDPIAKALLNLKSTDKMPKYVNYLGISVDNPTFISYLDEVRTKTAEQKVRVKTVEELEVGDRIYMTKYWCDLYTNEQKRYTKIHYIRHIEDADLRVSRLHKADNDYANSRQIRRIVSTIPDYWNHKIRYHTSCIKFTKKIFKDQFTEQQYSDFCNNYMAYHPTSNILDRYKLEFVQGEKIKYWYHEDNYHPNTGSLIKSCMKYDKCQNFFDIYTENSQVQLCIVTDKSEKLHARCLIWDNKYFDRIYGKEDIVATIKQLLKDRGLIDAWLNNHSQFKIKLDIHSGDIDKFPYMDTFRYYDGNTIANYHFSDDCLLLNQTDGRYEGEDDRVECYISGELYNPDEVVYIERYDYYVHEDYAIYSDYYGESILEGDSIWSDAVNSYLWRDCAVKDYNHAWIPEDEAITLENGKWAWKYNSDLIETHDGSLYINDKDIVEINGNYYHVEDDELVGINGTWYLPNDDDIIFYEDEYYHVDDCVYSEYHGEHLPKDLCEFYNDGWFLKEEVASQTKLEFDEVG